MQAQDILTATRQMEETGMTRAQSEAVANTIAAAVAPLATKADLEALREEIKADMQALREEIKADMQALRGETRTSIHSLEANLKSEIGRVEGILNIAIEHMATKKELESLKVWMISGLLAVSGGLVTIALSIAVFAFRIGSGA